MLIKISIRNEGYQEDFQNLKQAPTNSPVFVPLDSSSMFRNHIRTFQVVFDGTFRQFDVKENDCAVRFMSLKLSGTEQKFTVNEWELVGLGFSLQQIRCNCKGTV